MTGHQLRRAVALLASVGLAAALLAGVSATPAEAKKKPTPITVTPAVPTRGVAFTLTGKLPTNVVRPVSAQYKVGKKWKTLATGTTGADGSYTLTASVMASQLSVRVVAKKVKVKHKHYAKIATKTRTFTTQAAPPTPTPPALAVTTTSLPRTTAGQTYTTTLTAANGTPPYTWTAIGLPIGFTLNPANWVVFGGTPTVGNYPVQVTVTDASAQTATASLTVRVGGVSRLLTAGRSFTCEVTLDGDAQCWGANGSGQLGDGSTFQRNNAVEVTGLQHGVIAISAGDAFACALRNTGAVLCWGSNSYGQLGDGSTDDRHTPVPVSGLSGGVTEIAAGGQHACALTDAATVVCWGRNGAGELGDGSYTSRFTPTAVPGLTGVVALSAGSQHTCAVDGAGALFCWGWNDKGQLGNASTTGKPNPTAVIGLSSNAAAVAAGAENTCAVAYDKVYCWGYNAEGELGNGGTSEAHTLSFVLNGPSPWTSPAIDTKGYHSCVIIGGGAVRCWGRGTDGQIGNGGYGNQLTPVAVSGLGSGQLAVATGGAHTCAMGSGGSTHCWGAGSDGQLGDGGTSGSAIPVAVTLVG